MRPLLSLALAAFLAGCGSASPEEADPDEVYAAINRAENKAENAGEAAGARAAEKKE
jgi:predicted small lipoprotein YifL